MTTYVESHTHSCQYSADGVTWTEFGQYVETITTHHGYQADRGTVAIACYVYPSGLAENDFLICSIDSTLVFNGFVARPGLHYIGNSVIIEGEGTGAKMANPWGGEGTDPELDALFNRVYESQTTEAIITNIAEAFAVPISLHTIAGLSIVRGTLYPVTLRVGQTGWSLIRGDGGLDDIEGYWTGENNAGVIVRAPFAVGLPDVIVAQSDGFISADRTPQGTESIINRCVAWGFEYEGGTIGGPGIGDYYLPNSNIPDPPKSRTHLMRSNFIESDSDALFAATQYVTRHNFPYDETNLVLIGAPTITIGMTIRIDSAALDHAGDATADRFIAEVSHRYGVGIGFETALKCIRTS